MLLILRHEPFEHLGLFAAILDHRGLACRYHDLGEPFLNEEYQAVIAMGGPMSANDDLPGLRDELALIGRFLAGDLPLLGVCLGAQIIAKALGAKVYRNRDLEIGWEPVWLTEAAKDDPVFGGLASPEIFFHWHGETFDLPAGAEWLAYSNKCKNQAYRYGRNIYGIQFHAEVTPEMIADWCDQPVNCGDVATLQAPIDPNLHNPRPAAERMLEAWLNLL
ncbi:MAG TPA: type 1 glutamine amidotransferase [Bryobacteraceae bacterium]|nr:type 1 glutamine amidotransferase [Bryobacteraceae bacterium]